MDNCMSIFQLQLVYELRCLYLICYNLEKQLSFILILYENIVTFSKVKKKKIDLKKLNYRSIAKCDNNLQQTNLVS